jgi:hypothetical protein
MFHGLHFLGLLAAACTGGTAIGLTLVLLRDVGLRRGGRQ